MTVTSDPARAIETERRGKLPPVPTDYAAMLNAAQRLALRNVENFGWELAFVRRPLFAPALFVVASPDRSRHAILEPDGALNREPGLVIRD
jgi:hypothetical protein